MQLSDRPLTQPATSRLPHDAPAYDQIIAAHSRSLAEDADGYDDPVTGMYVFTAAYLASRDCCDLGCRHCPYVAE